MDTLFIGQNIIKLDSVDSTNDYANKLLSQELDRPLVHSRFKREGRNVFDGTVVYALSQRTGRGQRGNRWESEPYKNLTFSIVLYPIFIRAEEQFMLSKVVSLGICDYVNSVVTNPALNNFEYGVKIKWPNDINIGDEKVAGILIENSIRSNEITHSVIGVGVNVNQTRFSSDIPNPTSIKLITGENFDLEICLSELCSCIEARYLQLKSGKKEEISNDYLKVLYWYQQMSIYEINGNKFTAIMTGISDQGKLILEKEDGGIIECNFEEVSFVE